MVPTKKVSAEATHASWASVSARPVDRAVTADCSSTSPPSAAGLDVLRAVAEDLVGLHREQISVQLRPSVDAHPAARLGLDRDHPDLSWLVEGAEERVLRW